MSTPTAQNRIQRVRLTVAPVPLSATLLNEQWSYAMLTSDSCHPTYLFCHRCHHLRQADLLRPQPLSTAIAVVAWFLDLLTLGSPCGFYPGLGTAAVACYTRTLVRIRYRLQGTGTRDAVQVLCCAHAVACQQQKELDKEGVLYHAPCMR